MSTPVMPVIRPKIKEVTPEEKSAEAKARKEDEAKLRDAPLPDIAGVTEQGFRAKKPER